MSEKLMYGLTAFNTLMTLGGWFAWWLVERATRRAQEIEREIYATIDASEARKPKASESPSEGQS